MHDESARAVHGFRERARPRAVSMNEQWLMHSRGWYLRGPCHLGMMLIVYCLYQGGGQRSLHPCRLPARTRTAVDISRYRPN